MALSITELVTRLSDDKETLTCRQVEEVVFYNQYHCPTACNLCPYRQTFHDAKQSSDKSLLCTCSKIMVFASHFKGIPFDGQKAIPAVSEPGLHSPGVAGGPTGHALRKPAHW